MSINQAARCASDAFASMRSLTRIFAVCAAAHPVEERGVGGIFVPRSQKDKSGEALTLSNSTRLLVDAKFLLR
jgi:hypothetical protein